MKSTTLIEMNDLKIIVRGFDLGHKISSNLIRVFTLSDLEYFEQSLDEIPNGLVRFANRQPQDPARLEPETVASPRMQPRIEILNETPKLCAKRTADEQVAGMQANVPNARLGIQYYRANCSKTACRF